MTETRAAKAQRLVDEGQVTIASQDNFSVGALVASKGARYQVFVYPNGHYFCDCFWGQLHAGTTDLCAHALAVRLVVEKEG